MNIRNRLYRFQFRSARNFKTSNFHQESQERLYENQFNSIETALHTMYTAFKNNIKMQETYLKLIKPKRWKQKNKTKQMKKVYDILSENKTDEITFEHIYEQEEKQRKERSEILLCTEKDFDNSQKQKITLSKNEGQNHPKKIKNTNLQKLTKQKEQQKLKKCSSNRPNHNEYSHLLHYYYRHLYSRLAQEITKKLTYFIINKLHLSKLIIYTTSEISKKLESLLKIIKDMKDTNMLYDIVRILYQENSIIEDKIYEAMVDEGHVVSVDEFFRINGEIMQEHSTLRMRNSQLSAISSEPSEKMEEQCQILKSSRFYQHQKALKDKNFNFSKRIGIISKDEEILDVEGNGERQKKFKQEKDFSNFQLINQEIEMNYTLALDKISQIMVINETFLQKQNGNEKSEKQQKKSPQLKIQKNQSNLSHHFQHSLQKWKRQNERKKSTKKKTPTPFLYFSSQFKKIIQELDQKKRKTIKPLNFNNLVHKTPNHSNSQIGKINNEATSFKNPLNIARLLGKRFKTIVSTQPGYMKKSQIIRNLARQKTQINNILKMYESRINDNSIIPAQLIKKRNTVNGHELTVNFSNLSLMKKMKQKKSIIINGQTSQKFIMNQDLINQAKEQYKRKVRQKNNEKMNDQDDQKNIDVLPDHRNFLKDVKIKSFYEQESSQLQDQYKNIQKDNDRERDYSNKKVIKKFHVNHQSQMQEKNLQKNNLMIKPEQYKRIQKVYQQFTNPLTSKYGFYNNSLYQQTRKKLQRCQINTMKIKKRRAKGFDEFEVRNTLTFGKKKHQLQKRKSPFIVEKQNQNLNLTVSCQTQRNALNKQLNNDFYFTPNHINCASICSFDQKKVQKLLQQYLEQHPSNLNQNYDTMKLKFKQIQSWKESNKNQLRKIKSLKSTPRNSQGKRFQVYSTQRRIKIHQ